MPSRVAVASATALASLSSLASAAFIQASNSAIGSTAVSMSIPSIAALTFTSLQSEQANFLVPSPAKQLPFHALCQYDSFHRITQGGRMPKNIVICCDGTGNEYGDHNSNVVQLYRALIIDGKRQVGYYHPGVGTEGSPTSTNKLRAAISVVAGLAIGAGILENVSDAYRYLMNVYEQGDNVYLFGFSRGAYTARAIAGVLHMFGLLCPGNEGLIPYVVRMYAKRTRKADGKTHTFAVASGFKATFCRSCPPHMVGLWDTVSSVGWIWDPLKLPYTARNPDMAHGRHAISIDERRCYFRNNMWGEPFPGQDIKQVWFTGVHSDIGGSYSSSESGLSQITLQWMLCEAVSVGLLVNPDQ